jgi:hypothetical protein
MLDIDMSGLPCGPKAGMSCKGYFSKAGIRYGRQLGRVIASLYEEIVVDHPFAGNVQLTSALRPLVSAAEDVLQLDYNRRQRTLLRMDAGGGSLDDLNWCLARGYQLHCKDFSSKRAEAWAATVQEWFDDLHHQDRQFGWVIPADSLDYVRPGGASATASSGITCLSPHLSRVKSWSCLVGPQSISTNRSWWLRLTHNSTTSAPAPLRSRSKRTSKASG